jgi:molybdopterin converting factor subunit 1
MSISVIVLFFASAREATGVGEVTIKLDAGQQNASYLLQYLQEEYTGLDFQEAQISVAVNKNYIGDDDVVLKDGDEVALLPPIAGG